MELPTLDEVLHFVSWLLIVMHMLMCIVSVSGSAAHASESVV